MGSKIIRSKPSFSQILIMEDFTRSLRVPRVFAEKYEDILTENARLKIRSGETWAVKVELMDDGFYYFTDGWKKFAEDVGLKRSDFLTFSFTRSSTFDVYAHGRDGCGKALFGRTYELIEDSDDEDATKVTREAECSRNSNPKFELLLGVQNVSRVYIPKHFAEEAGLIGKEKVTLEYRKSGFRSEVVLDDRQKNVRLNVDTYRFDMANGWRAFRIANRLRYGKKYRFEFVPSKGVVEVMLKGNQ